MSEMFGETVLAEADGIAASVKVRVMPLDVEIEVATGETLLQAAQRAGFSWPSLCGGNATCLTCFVKIETGLDAASVQSAWERERLDLAGRRGPEFRLACQLAVAGPMRVIKRGLKAPVEQN
jgi:2Fe-2S ferredoxin